MAKTNFTVVRNEACPVTRVSVRERHNERKNENYFNGDVVPERSEMNVHFHRNFRPDGTPESYQETIDRLLEEGTIVKRNFKPKSAIIDELVFDVNTDYFERNGGYEFAKRFYEEAYRLAVKEVGDERYILSAVLHADERNKALSDALGHDVFHYHLHVVYVPVVRKEIKWTKRAGPELAGKVKAVIPQVNHTDKWPRIKVGRGYVNEYSKLQDRYHDHMKAAGFDGFERGERGSTAEHLDVLDFKIQQDERRLEALDRQGEKKEARIEKLDAKLEVRQTKAATLDEINAMGHGLPLVPGVHFSDDEAKRLKSLACKSIGIDKRAEEYRKNIAALNDEIRDMNSRVNQWRQSYGSVVRERDSYKQNYDRLWAEVKPFIEAIRRFPRQLMDFIQKHLPLKNQNREVTK
jgi:prefoldin subunit 5